MSTELAQSNWTLVAQHRIDTNKAVSKTEDRFCQNCLKPLDVWHDIVNCCYNAMLNLPE